jgi:DNA-binding NarL/FixJ family response regulator
MLYLNSSTNLAETLPGENVLMQSLKIENEAEPLRVIVVDDRSAVRESLKIVLTLEDDIEVVGEAGSGRQAVALAQAVRPDVVLMDCEMPDEKGANFDGIDACQEIKERRLAQAVIILTMHADAHSRQRAQLAGCDLFLEKGIDTGELLTQLRKVGGR